MFYLLLVRRSSCILDATARNVNYVKASRLYTQIMKSKTRVEFGIVNNISDIFGDSFWC